MSSENDRLHKELYHGREFLVPMEILPGKVKDMAKREVKGEIQGKRETIEGREFFRITSWTF